jgi:cytochrome c nitrite reductase small subunit
LGPKPARPGLAGVALACALGAFIGSGLITFRYAEGLSYLSNDPGACVNCHIMRDQFDGWQKAPHHAHAACNDCHVPHDLVGKYLTKAEHGYRHSKGFTLQDFHEPIRMKESSHAIVVDNCIRCHEQTVSEINASRKAPGTGGHDALAGVLDCLHCHASVGHGPTR